MSHIDLCGMRRTTINRLANSLFHPTLSVTLLAALGTMVRPVENTSPKETWCPARLCPNLSYIDIFGAFGYILGTNQKKKKSTANKFSPQDQPAGASSLSLNA
jgi:hypothetical protein